MISDTKPGIFCICLQKKKVWHSGIKKKIKLNRLYKVDACPSTCSELSNKGLRGSTKMFRGTILALGTDESPSIWLYCQRPTDWMMSSAWKERQEWGPESAGAPSGWVLAARFRAALPQTLRARAQRAPRLPNGHAAALHSWAVDSF